MSAVHGVTAVVFDFVRQLPKSEGPGKALLMKWLSDATGVEQTMRRMQVTAEEFAEAMEKWEIPVVVLKGLAFAQYYPNPLHRECGDLDCYMMGKKEEGDLAAVELGVSLATRVSMNWWRHSQSCMINIAIQDLFSWAIMKRIWIR